MREWQRQAKSTYDYWQAARSAEKACHRSLAAVRLDAHIHGREGRVGSPSDEYIALLCLSLHTQAVGKASSQGYIASGSGGETSAGGYCGRHGAHLHTVKDLR